MNTTTCSTKGLRQLVAEISMDVNLGRRWRGPTAMALRSVEAVAFLVFLVVGFSIFKAMGRSKTLNQIELNNHSGHCNFPAIFNFGDRHICLWLQCNENTLKQSEKPAVLQYKYSSVNMPLSLRRVFPTLGLLYKVFSVKYFPNGNILEAPVHPWCSFAWRSILQSRDVINKGAVWRVGNGESIKIWKHNWFPDHSNSKVVSPRTNTDALFVKDLFLEGRRVWDPG